MESQITTNFWGQDSDKAFRYLYDKYAATLRYFSAKYVDDDATIEDIVQDAFLNLWEKRNEFKTELIYTKSSVVSRLTRFAVETLLIDTQKKLFSKKKIKNSFWKTSLNPKSFK